MKILDSDFLIAVLRQDPEAKSEIENLMGAQDIIATTVLNAQEVLYGANITDDKNNYKKTQQFLESMNIVDYSIDCVHQTLKLQSILSKKGVPIGIMDEMIAGTCIAKNASIVTRNTKHFSKVPDLIVEKW